MKPCDTCGNEIDEKATVCPYCMSPQKEVKSSQKPKGPEVRKVVIKEGQPTVDEAVVRLKEEVTTARKDGIRVLKVVHGYGSSGRGGAIKGALLGLLRTWRTNGEIRNFITGEEHFDHGARHNYLLRRYPELEQTWKSDRGNPGITFIEL